MVKQIVMIDATRVITKELDDVFHETIPNIEIVHMIDEGILKFEDTSNKRLARRFCNLAVAAEEIGADAIVITCAHAIRIVNTVQMLVNPPVVQITLPMIESAVNRAETIGIVSTEEAIIQPIMETFYKTADAIKKRVTLKVGLCPEAFKARLAGDTAKHDELVVKTIEDISKSVGIVVLAQVSLARVLPNFTNTPGPIIMSPLTIAAEKVRHLIE